jgi:hypothetical protein
MSADQLDAQLHLPASGVDRPIDAGHACQPSSQSASERLPRVVLTGVSTDTVEALLLSVARGDQEAFVALQSRMAGLVRANVRRVLRDASRTEAVTRETFAEVLEEAIHFDPHRDSAQTWLLTRAHQHAIDALRSAGSTDDPQGPMIDPPTLVLLP